MMDKLEYLVLTESEPAVSEVEAARVEKGVSIAGVSRKAEMPDTGQQYLRMRKKKDVALGRFIRFADALGYDVVMVKRKGEAEA